MERDSEREAQRKFCGEGVEETYIWGLDPAGPSISAKRSTIQSIQGWRSYARRRGTPPSSAGAPTALKASGAERRAARLQDLEGEGGGATARERGGNGGG
jgi:hypothetical protein